MAVLCEAISVVIRADLLIEAYGTFDEFKSSVPHEALAADNELVRLSFMDPDDAKRFIRILEGRGLVYQKNGIARDFVVIDQLRGVLCRCDWIEFGHFSKEGEDFAAARLSGSTIEELITPEGWVPEGSLTKSFVSAPSERRVSVKNAKFTQNNEGNTVITDTVTGVEIVLEPKDPKNAPDPEKLARRFRRGWTGSLY